MTNSIAKIIFIITSCLIFCMGCVSNREVRNPQDGFRIEGVVVTDTRTGLMWTRDANIARKLLNWNSGVNLVHGLNTGGYHDWRLPTEKELMNLKSYFAYMPYDSLNRLGFANVSGDYDYMSSDTCTYGVLSISFRFGYKEDAAHLAEGSPNGLKPYVGSVAIPIEQENELVWAVRDVR